MSLGLGGIPKVVPPLLCKGTLGVGREQFAIRSETTEKGLKMLSQNVLILGQKGIPK